MVVGAGVVVVEVVVGAPVDEVRVDREVVVSVRVVVTAVVVVGRVRLAHGPGMHWYCAALGRPGTFINVVKHCPRPVGFTEPRPSTAAHAGFGRQLDTAQSSEPHVTVVTD